MKRGKGQGIDLGGGTNNTNKWKAMIANATKGLPVREFTPVVVKPHPRQAAMDAYRQIPSLVR